MADSDACRAATLAALETVQEDCGTADVPVETSNGLVVMAPEDDARRLRQTAPGDLSDEEFETLLEESPWLEDWASSICEGAGLEPGTSAYEECLLNYAESAFGGALD